jgi:hypothetical protein
MNRQAAAIGCNIPEINFCFAQTVVDRECREGSPVLNAAKPLLFGYGSNSPPASSGMSVVGIDPEYCIRGPLLELGPILKLRFLIAGNHQRALSVHTQELWAGQINCCEAEPAIATDPLSNWDRIDVPKRACRRIINDLEAEKAGGVKTKHRVGSNTHPIMRHNTEQSVHAEEQVPSMTICSPASRRAI